MNKEILLKELNFKAVRSSGAGGQHVNKVSSKIELSIDIKNSLGLTDREKDLLYQKLANRLTKDQILILFCDKSRSQHQNKSLAVTRFFELVQDNLVRPKYRKPTRPSRSSVVKKSENKQRQSVKKSLRKKPRLE